MISALSKMYAAIDDLSINTLLEGNNLYLVNVHFFALVDHLKPFNKMVLHHGTHSC